MTLNKGALIFFLMAQREAPLCFYFRECQIFPNFFGDAKINESGSFNIYTMTFKLILLILLNIMAHITSLHFCVCT
jgi:hypothetical protein